MSCWNRLGQATVVRTTTAKSMRQYIWEDNSLRRNNQILEWFKVYILVLDSRCLLLVYLDYLLDSDMLLNNAACELFAFHL